MCSFDRTICDNAPTGILAAKGDGKINARLSNLHGPAVDQVATEIVQLVCLEHFDVNLRNNS